MKKNMKYSLLLGYVVLTIIATWNIHNIALSIVEWRIPQGQDVQKTVWKPTGEVGEILHLHYYENDGSCHDHQIWFEGLTGIPRIDRNHFGFTICLFSIWCFSSGVLFMVMRNSGGSKQ